MDQPGVKVLSLTGKLLRLEEQRLRSTPGFSHMEEFLRQRGLTISDPMLEGYYLYRQTGPQPVSLFLQFPTTQDVLAFLLAVSAIQLYSMAVGLWRIMEGIREGKSYE